MAKATAVLQVMVSGATKFKNDITGTQKTTNSAFASMSKESKKAMASMVAQYASVAVVIAKTTKIINEGIDFNRFVESVTTSFSVFMKSATAAKKEISDLYDFAVHSPLTFKETVTGSKQLLAYGFAAKSLIPTMNTLGTVAIATGHSLEDISYVYGTLKSQGRAYSRDLMQFGMRGIPIYEELAKVMGVSSSEIQKMTAAGKVGFEEVEQAFKNMTTGTGRYAGTLEAYMTTLQGKEAQLSDIWQKTEGTLTSGITAVRTQLVDLLTEKLGDAGFQETIEDLGGALGELASIVIEVSGYLFTLLKVIADISIFLSNNAPIITVVAAWVAYSLVIKVLIPLMVGLSALIEGLPAFIALTKASLEALNAQLAGTTIAVDGLAASMMIAVPALLIVAATVASVLAIQRQYQKELEATTAKHKELMAELQREAEIHTQGASSYSGLTKVVDDNIEALEKARNDFTLEAIKANLANNKLTNSVAVKDNSPIDAGWVATVKDYANEWGFIQDDVAQVLYDTGKINKETAGALGFTPKVSTKGFSTELTTFQKMFSEASLGDMFTSGQIDTMFANAQERIPMFVSDMKEGFSAIRAESTTLADDLADFLGNRGIDMSNLTDSMAKAFQDMYNDPDSDLTAYFEYMTTKAEESSIGALQHLNDMGVDMSDELKTVITANAALYKDKMGAMAEVDQNTGNKLFAQYKQRFDYWSKMLTETTTSTAKKLYDAVGTYFDDWKIKLTITGIDDMTKTMSDAIGSVRDILQGKIQSYRDALISDANIGADKSSSTIAKANATAAVNFAKADMASYTEYAKSAIDDIQIYYKQQLSNLHFSELLNGIDEFFTNLEGEAYDSYISGFDSLGDSTTLLGRVIENTANIISGVGKQFAAQLLEDTELGALISGLMGETADTPEQEIQSGIVSMVSSAQEAFDTVRAYVEAHSESSSSAASNIDVSSFTGDTASSGTTSGDMASSGATSGDMASGGATGGAGVLMQMVAAIVTAMKSIEGVSEVLDPFTTIAEALVDVFDDLVSSALEPIVDILKMVGTYLGTTLRPLLAALYVLLLPFITQMKIMEAALQVLAGWINWFYDNIIVPIANKLIDIVNGVITALNKIPFVSIAYIDALKTSTEALDDFADSASNAQSNLDSTISYLESKYSDLIDGQADSLQDLYEVGAISGADYTAQIDALNAQRLDDSTVSDDDQALTTMEAIAERLSVLYSLQSYLESNDLDDEDIVSALTRYGISTISDTDAKLTAINQWLKDISGYTNETAAWLNSMATGSAAPVAYASDTGSDTDEPFTAGDVVDGIIDTVVDVATTVADTVAKAATTAWDIVSGWFGFATGTSNVPYDMPANIHKGEGIIPATFMDGIRSGELSLSSGNNASGASGNTYVSVSVSGSVTSESDLADAISTRLYKMKRSGTATIRG